MTHPYRGIPELAEWQVGGPLVRIPMQQDVPFTPRVRAIVDTAEFQRLRHITQLGLASRVYPGAVHTRFEHVLGVFHNAIRYLWQLGKDERFAATVTPHQAEVVLVAALLHDLGHWPFCHPIEDMGLKNLPPHEEFAAEFLSPDRELGQVLRVEWRMDPEDVLAVLKPRESIPGASPAIRLMRSILSGPIDIDKLDYLERDSLHAGVPYGRNFDRNRLVQSLLVNEAGDGLAISTKGKTAAELMVFARYVMFSEVYWHHAVRSATCMFARGFYEVHTQFDLRELFQCDEVEFIHHLRGAARQTRVASLFDHVFGAKRKLHKRVIEFSLHEQPDLYQKLASRPFAELVDLADRLRHLVSQNCGVDMQPADLLIDGPPVHKEVQFAVEVYHTKSKRYVPFDELSPVIAALARTQFDDYVKRVRVFAAPEVAMSLSNHPRFLECLQDVAAINQPRAASEATA